MIKLTNYRNCTIVAFVGTVELDGKITNLQKITHYEISPKLLFHLTKSVRHCGDKDFLTRSLDLTKSCSCMGLMSAGWTVASLAAEISLTGASAASLVSLSKSEQEYPCNQHRLN